MCTYMERKMQGGIHRLSWCLVGIWPTRCSAESVLGLLGYESYNVYIKVWTANNAALQLLLLVYVESEESEELYSHRPRCRMTA
jgi:hypothetical protein